MIKLENERLRRQKELARLFFEMGMSEDLVLRVSGLTKEQLHEVDNKDQNSYNKQDKNTTKNNSYLEPRD